MSTLRSSAVVSADLMFTLSMVRARQLTVDNRLFLTLLQVDGVRHLCRSASATRSLARLFESVTR